jgi:hypothetical protein
MKTSDCPHRTKIAAGRTVCRAPVLILAALLAVASPAAATIQFAQATAEVWEGQGGISICLTRTPGDVVPAEYYAIAVPGTADGNDFTMGWVNIYTPWPAGQSTVMLNLGIANDAPEGDETFSVVMIARSGSTFITGSPSTMVITIHDGTGPSTDGCSGGGPTPTPSPTSTPPPPTPTPTITPTPVPTPVGTPSFPITALGPNSGHNSGGTVFSIYGAGFQPNSEVYIGGFPATNETWIGDGQVDAISPAGLAAGGLHPLVLQNPPGGGFGMLPGGWLSDFLDVAQGHPFHDFVETLIRNGVTAGCGGGSYCVDAPVTRGQMAVFLLVSKEGIGYVPPVCTAPVFADVPCSHPFARWINELANPTRAITAGCGGGNYCPGDPVTREQMAAFLLRTFGGAAYDPPACVTPTFSDVPCSNIFAAWINELALRGITSGCGGGNYCGSDPVTRGQMAVFLATTFGLPPDGPPAAPARAAALSRSSGGGDPTPPSTTGAFAALAGVVLTIALSALRAGPLA